MFKNSDYTFTQVPNRILETLAKTRIAGVRRQMLDVIIRQTYGFHKKQAWINLSVFKKMTGKRIPHIIRAINDLKSLDIIVVITKESKFIFSINEEYNSWKTNVNRKSQLSKKPIGKDRKTKSIYFPPKTGQLVKVVID